jgi:acyl-[acyl-carrier-protein]-phospholipid O-acyltransferase/long-chain-fatty-acid--[acyl-carrier-protein] ligase
VFAAVQAWSPPAYRARSVAAVNVLNAAFMTGASVLAALLQKNGVSVAELFLGIGATTALVAFVIWKTMPTAR